MFEAYWGLNRSPFGSAAGREALASSPVHAEALARLDYLRENHSPLGLLVGAGGSGKSAVLAEFAARAARAGTLVGLVPAAAAEEAHVLPAVAESLQVAADGNLAALWRSVADRLAELRFGGLTAVLLFDDLDRAAASTLNFVERLLALPSSPLTVVAAVQSETAARLGRRLLEQAALRIELAPWSEAESREYLERSLSAAGRVQPAFDAAAARRLFELSGGAPRRMNQLAQLALLAGAGQRLVIVEASTIDAVQEELSFA